MMKNIKEHKPEEEWSWESDNDGLVDWCVTAQGPAPFLAVHSASATRFRLYDLDWAYEELLTLPKVYPIIERAIKEGRGRPGHEGGPRLYHEMAQHLPAGTPGGQSWHRDGDLIRCTFTLNDLGPDDGGTVLLPGSHRDGFGDNLGEILNSQELVEYEDPFGEKSSGFDRSANQPHRMPTYVSQTGPAGSCLINWTMLWHTRPPSKSNVDRNVIWQIYRRPNQGCGQGRRQHQPTRAWINKIKESGTELQKMIVDDSEAPEDDRWDFEGLSTEEQAKAQAAEPLYPTRAAAL